MHLSPVLLVHICAATISLIAGTLSMLLRKGSGRHAAAGCVFAVAMLLMSSTGAYIAAVGPNRGSFVVAVLTFYLVATAWIAGPRRTGKPGRFDAVAMVVAAVIGTRGMVWGFEAAATPKGILDHLPAAVYFVFSSVALLCAAGDLRMFVRGGIFGPKRVVRHLWRMCFAFLIAAMSFYPGQAKLFPAALRASNILYVPILLLAAATLFWVVRVSFSKAFRRRIPDAGPPAESVRLVQAPSSS